jgi:signal transduction histidine kinase
MLLAVAAVAVLAFWDERRESASTLDDFAEEQTTLAGSMAAELGTRIEAARRDASLIAEALVEGRKLPRTALVGYAAHALRPAEGAPLAGPGVRISVDAPDGRALDLLVPPAALLQGAARVEHPALARLFLIAPGDAYLRGTDGSVIESAPVFAAFAAERTAAWLDRPEAAALGLKPRRAAVGLARVDAGELGRWGVAVVQSAERVRDRERRAAFRLGFGVLLAAGLVFLFGTAALRRQRRGLLLERELALAALGRERDAELATASRAATLGTLAMGIAHEVSTPLGVIAGRAEQLVPRVEGDERAARAVRAIQDQAERIRRVIRAFLDLVRGGAPTLAEATPASVLEGAIGLVEHRFAAAGVTLEKRAPADLPAIRGDVPMLQQALVNLFLNACDACGRGGKVTASAERDGDRVTFSVTDDGRGITVEEAARATELFFTTKAPGAGSGLGLAITNEIVKLHRGRFTLAPASPRGTQATITIPLGEESSPKGRSPGPESHAAAG